jgi:ABC-type transport system substrate-binding protein
MLQTKIFKLAFVPIVAALAAMGLFACAGETIIQTVEVPVERQVEVRVVETVVVEKQVEVAGETIIQTVEVPVERQVEVRVVETVVIERERIVEGRTVVETVVVEREVVKEVEREVEVEVIKEVEVVKEVEKEVEVKVVETVVVKEEVEKIVIASPTPAPETFYGLPIPVAAPTISEPPVPATGSDTVVIRTGLELRGSGIPGDPTGGMFTGSSVTEKFFLTDAGGNAVNQIITNWELVEDANALEGKAFHFTLKENVPFHNHWGEFGNLSADDVVWAYNKGNPGFNPESATDGGSNWVTFIGNQPLTKIDDQTVRVPLQEFDVRWDTLLFGQSGLGLSITSKNAFDTMGEDWVRDHVVGTGPYMVEEYAYDATLQLRAVQNHHRKTPEVDRIIYEPIVEDAVAEAALRTGGIDVAQVDLRNYPTLTQEGFEIIGAGAGSFHSISFSGNYWQNSIYTSNPDDEEVPITLHATVQHHIPWIGDPRRDNFGNPPEGMTSMSRAAQVRQALSFAIDRALIAEVLFANAAWVNYVYGHDINNPNWQDKWNVEYNPELAGRMLDEAGYPKNANGIRFEMPFFIRIGRGDEEIGTAVVGMWRELGIDMQDWKAQYQTYRPSLIGRTATAPWIHSAGAESPQAPWDWPVVSNAECSGGRPGFNIGIEIQELCEWGTAMNRQQDKQARIEIRNQMADFLHTWNPAIGTVARPNVALVNPKKIASWDMPLSVREAALHHPEFIVTVK